jgi:putative peptide zinc metalloprotease protein
VRDPGGTITPEVGGAPCLPNNPTQVFPIVAVSDDHDSSGGLKVTVHWSGFASGSAPMSPDGNYYGAIGPVTYSGQPNDGGDLKIWVTAIDSGGAATTLDGSPVHLTACRAAA